jgi:hypothetical protein
MKYLKIYDTEADFMELEGNEYITSLQTCVGLVDEDREVKFNKDYENIITFYDVTNESGTSRIYNESDLTGANLMEVIIDRVKVPKSQVTKNYTFGNPGNHSIIWRFKNSASIPRAAFSGCTDIYHIVFSSKFESFSGGYTFTSCPKMATKTPVIIPEKVKNMGTSTFLINSSNHIYRTFILLPKTPPKEGANSFAIKRPGQGPYTGQDTTLYVPWSEDGSILQAYEDTYNSTFSYAGNKFKIYELTRDGKIPDN